MSPELDCEPLGESVNEGVVPLSILGPASSCSHVYLQGYDLMEQNYVFKKDVS